MGAGRLHLGFPPVQSRWTSTARTILRRRSGSTTSRLLTGTHKSEHSRKTDRVVLSTTKRGANSRSFSRLDMAKSGHFGTAAATSPPGRAAKLLVSTKGCLPASAERPASRPNAPPGCTPRRSGGAGPAERAVLVLVGLGTAPSEARRQRLRARPRACKGCDERDLEYAARASRISQGRQSMDGKQVGRKLRRNVRAWPIARSNRGARAAGRHRCHEAMGCRPHPPKLLGRQCVLVAAQWPSTLIGN
jgi:hypothetical protein